jgi:hypothetical protein
MPQVGAGVFVWGDMPSIVTWTYAPEWLTPAEAAALLGRAYSEDTILALLELGAFEAEETAEGWLIEKRSLQEYQESLWEVSADEDER